MKTIISVLIVVLFLSSCKDGSNDRMLTRVNKDGSCYREISTSVDSSFMVGDTAKSKSIVVQMNKNWIITKTDSGQNQTIPWPQKKWVKGFTPIKIHQDFKSVDDMAKAFKFDKKHPWHNFKIHNSLETKFRWFYTYFTYKEIYPKLDEKFSLPISRYLTRDESDFYFNGNQSLIKGMNGVEIHEFTKVLDEKINKWLQHNFWNDSYDKIILCYDSIGFKTVSKEKLIQEKDSAFYVCYDELNKDEKLEKCLDKYFKTTEFSKNLEKNPYFNQMIGNSENAKFDCFFNALDYNLIMPGKLIQTNSQIIHRDTLQWKITAYRMVLNDCMISATSRVANVWAFIVSGLLVLLAIGSFIYKRHK
jgi:hypothetical protein